MNENFQIFFEAKSLLKQEANKAFVEEFQKILQSANQLNPYLVGRCVF